MGRVVIMPYEVHPRDTLAGLARRYGTASDYLRSTNNGLGDGSLSPGKTILVHNGRGMVRQVRERKGRPETLAQLAKNFGLSPAAVARANGLPGVALLSETWVQPGRLLFLPGARMRFADFMAPVEWVRGRRFVSSGFGMRWHPVFKERRFHTGWDLPRPRGSAVKAARGGVVIFADWRGGYGRLIIIKHPGGLRTWYGHLSAFAVSPGERVTQGRFIGRVGSTGISTGPHLHFEVRDRYGNSLNPKKFL
jgi:murein DD-endopeptidase MepM/ murein hydrolase activator NlpD